MKLKIVFENRTGQNIEYKEFPNFFHKLFATALFEVTEKNEKIKKKKQYSFKIPDFKILEKNKEYVIYFNSSKIEYMKAIVENIDKSNKIKVKEIKEISNSYDNSKPLLVKGICYSLSSGFCKSKNIDTKRGEKEKININFTTKYHDMFLLKELMEYQITKDFNKISEQKLELSKIGNVEYNECIETIMIQREYFRIVDGFNVPCLDIAFKLNKSINVRLAQKIGNFILQDGIGAKNSFGFGYVYQEEK